MQQRYILEPGDIDGRTLGPSGWMGGEYLGKLCGGEVAGTILKDI